MNHKEHYTESYFKWQGSIGEFGGWANLEKFLPYIDPNDKLADFGCGGGFLLKNINCADKTGIEVNETARAQALENGVKTVSSPNELPSNSFDTIISNNALEHTLHPLEELRSLYKILKPGGKMVFMVPCESISYDYKPNDINYHLYSWSPMCIGNLFNEAGFQVLESKAHKYKWPPYYRRIAKVFGRRGFNLASKIYARWETTWYQVRIIATKPE